MLSNMYYQTSNSTMCSKPNFIGFLSVLSYFGSKVVLWYQLKKIVFFVVYQVVSYCLIVVCCRTEKNCCKYISKATYIYGQFIPICVHIHCYHILPIPYYVAMLVVDMPFRFASNM